MRIEFERQVIRLTAVKKAAYQLSGFIACQISLTPTHIVCDIETILASEESPERDWLKAFRSSVLDYELREEIGERTEQIRNALLAAAFAPLTAKLKN